MTVTLKCDLCGKTVVLVPGEHSFTLGTAQGWKWREFSGYQMQIRIPDETVCKWCLLDIEEAKKEAEYLARERIRQS